MPVVVSHIKIYFTLIMHSLSLPVIFVCSVSFLLNECINFNRIRHEEKSILEKNNTLAKVEVDTRRMAVNESLVKLTNCITGDSLPNDQASQKINDKQVFVHRRTLKVA